MRKLDCGMALLAATVFASTGAVVNGQQGSQQKPTGTTGVAGATVERIADSPAEWYGKKVTVRAKVGDVFSRKVFNVEEEGVIDVDDEVLIVNPKGNTYLKADEMVTVTGTVRQFVRGDIERTYDGLDWDLAPDLLLQFERRPVIIADSVAPASGK